MMAVEPVLSTVSETCGSTAHCKVGKVSATDDTRCATGKFGASVAVSFNVDAGRNGATADTTVLARTTTRFGVRHVSGRELGLLLDPPSSFRPAGEFKSNGMRSAEIDNIDNGCNTVTDCERVLIQRHLGS